jgi:hypothetical protein
MKGTTRRNFLRGAAGASLLLPHLNSLGGRRARAQTAAPKRLIVLYVPQQEAEGFLPQTSPGLSLAGSYMGPLAPFANKLLWVHNLHGRNGHMEGHTECLTGYAAADWKPPQGPSLDQYIASRLGTTTPLRSLELTGGSPWESNKDWAVVSWSDKTLPMQAITDPKLAFQRVFGAVGSTGDAAAAETQRRQKMQKSLIDSLIGDYDRVSRSMSTGDRQLLDAHLTLLREQEARLQKDATSTRVCVKGASPPDLDHKEYPARIKHHIDTIVGAVRCDATRVFTMMFGIAQEGREHTWLGLTDNFHSVAHGDAPDFQGQHFKVRKWQAEQIAYLLKGLDSIPEGNGTALDNTVVAWINELGFYPWSQDHTGRHFRKQVSTLLMGGAGGYFKTGRLVDVQQADYCNLLVTLAHAMGYEDVTSFGKFGTKPLTELRG